MHVQAVRRLSPAFVVAMIALFIALGGTATAAGVALITGKQIKDGSIGLADLSPKAKAGLKGARGAQGPIGPMGPAGVAGPTGPTGGFNPAKIVYRVGADTTIVAGSASNALSVSCLAGETAISGGFASDVGYPYASAPGADRTTWTVLVDAFDFAQNGTGRAYVVCAQP
jgi:hypothetical protein